MTAHQIFRGAGIGRASAGWALLGSWLALAACSGSIEETDVDAARAERARNGGAPPAAAPASTTTGTTAAPSTSAPPAPSSTPPASSAPPPAASEPEADPPAAGDLSFATDIWPIFTAKCAPCHTTSNLGNQNIGDADKAAALEDTLRIEARIISDIETGRMPIGCGGPPGSAPICVSADDFELIEEWFESGTPP